MTLSTVCMVVGMQAALTGPGLTEEEKKEGFVSLFNGKDLTGWHYVGDKEKVFLAGGGELRCNSIVGRPRGNFPEWLRSDKIYENFVLRFDYKIPYYCESGLVICAPLHGRLSKVGIKIVITEDTCRGAKTQHTGTILGVKRELAQAAPKHSTWYPMEVKMDWPMLRVTLNGKLVQEVNCEKEPQLRYRTRRGYIGFTAMGAPCSFRNIRIKELPSKEKWVDLLATIPGIDQNQKWIALEKGKDLGGWNILNDVKWWVRDGVLRATGNGYLITDGEWQDFELFTYIRTTPLANGGIFFRWKGLDTKDRAYEIQIYNNPDGNNPTGSVYRYDRNCNLPVLGTQWFPMQIFVKGKTIVTRVNGEPGVLTDDRVEFVRPGRISLQMHRHGAQIEWKDLRIKPLK